MTTNGRQFRLQSLSGTTKHLSLMITIKLTFLFRSNSVEFCNYFLYTKPSRHFLKFCSLWSMKMFGVTSLFFIQINNRSCLRGPNEQKVAISLHQFEVIHGALVAQKSDHISCKIKVKVHEKKKFISRPWRRSIEINYDAQKKYPTQGRLNEIFLGKPLDSFLSWQQFKKEKLEDKLTGA